LAKYFSSLPPENSLNHRLLYDELSEDDWWNRQIQYKSMYEISRLMQD
jgi:hypothetical protein